ncbi:hypothetical protein [Azospirillum sp. B510]|nr:hypothetical protein [Azospirillum sp. B510]
MGGIVDVISSIANEVRNLANQSANATAQISKEIEGMQTVLVEVV